MQKTRLPVSIRCLLSVAGWLILAAGCATTTVTRPPQPVSAPPRIEPAPPTAKPQVTPTVKPEPRSRLQPAPETERLSKRPPLPPPKVEPSPLYVEATAMMAKMTLEEKVGQLFILQLRDQTSGRLYQQATPGALEIVRRFHPGGVILFGGNIDRIDQTRSLVEGLQRASATPLFIAVDEEGGEVSRLTASGKMHAVHMPPAALVGETDDPALAFREGRFIGRELLSLGINMDLAPVADVHTNPKNTVIGNRSFSANPQVAAMMTGAMVRGLQSVQVSSVVKHFPGHGDTAGDSHLGAAIVHQNLSRLERVEFLPFEAGIAAGADGVLIGHLLLPEILEQKQIPATFSPYILGTLLRGQLGFRKLIITDALNMGAIVDFWSSGEAALDAFQAGADMLLMPEDPSAAFDALLKAVTTGEITQARLDDSVRRILMVKIERQVIGEPPPRPDPHKLFGSPEGAHLLKEIEREAASHR